MKFSSTANSVECDVKYHIQKIDGALLWQCHKWDHIDLNEEFQMKYRKSLFHLKLISYEIFIWSFNKKKKLEKVIFSFKLSIYSFDSMFGPTTFSHWKALNNSRTILRYFNIALSQHCELCNVKPNCNELHSLREVHNFSRFSKGNALANAMNL